MPAFEYRQAEEVRDIFRRHHVRYLFIGKSGAILLGYPDTTQDADLFVEKSPANCRALVTALRELGFALSETQAGEIEHGKDFVQLKSGPFDLDLVFAPDGITSFADAQTRGVREGIFQIASLRDIIASKRASGRKKDEIELPLLENFRVEYEKIHAPPLRSAGDIAAKKTSGQ